MSELIRMHISDEQKVLNILDMIEKYLELEYEDIEERFQGAKMYLLETRKMLKRGCYADGPEVQICLLSLYENIGEELRQRVEDHRQTEDWELDDFKKMAENALDFHARAIGR
jgi:hypothetical protein